MSLKELIKNKGLNIRSLSKRLDIAESNIFNYISGKQTPTLDTSLKIAIALDIDLKTLCHSLGYNVDNLRDDVDLSKQARIIKLKMLIDMVNKELSEIN